MILVLSGTSDGRKIIKKLLSNDKKVLSTTTTKYGSDLMKNHKNLIKVSKVLSKNELMNLIINNNIKKIVDATHPYAYEISSNAMEISSLLEIEYFRYERDNEYDIEKILRFNSYNEITDYLKNTSGNILLTIGSKNLEEFEKINKERLFPRILPTSKMVKKCENLGYKPFQIIAIQGPFDSDINLAIYNKYDIKYIVTKESSKAGGFLEKVLPAIKNGISVLTLKRETLEYKNEYNDFEKLIKNVI